MLSRLDTIHSWHLNVHEYEFVSSICAATLLRQVLFKLGDGYLARLCLTRFDLEDLLDVKTENVDVKIGIVNYEDLWFTVAWLRLDDPTIDLI